MYCFKFLNILNTAQQCFQCFSMVMSIWGVIFLGLLGVFFYVQAVTLFPDLHFSEETKDGGHVAPSVEYVYLSYLLFEIKFRKIQRRSVGRCVPLNNSCSFRDIETKYSEKAMQCWIAAGMYGVTLILVFWQNKYNATTVF
ncbi:unnamed protein product [Angiostrongylus costaricensis]|uniref:Serine incorporator 5 n=1 Tax=Angiostrongylus costaricensis TaxID=334426 RepID=A0A0R3P9S3_ANGCS|nr:unnamed protein product [Angiostrongylus costaricensis]